jgi:hypothetical protein
MLAGEWNPGRPCTLQCHAYVVNPFPLPFKASGQLEIPGAFLNMSNVYKDQAKKAIWNRFKSISPHTIDSKGYLKDLTHNLLPNVRLEQFEHDLIQGSGDELGWKFRAVHSSSALVVNTFAPLKETPSELNLIDINGFESIRLEKKLPTGLSGTPPNVDLIAENDTDVVAVESKFLEYFVLKKPIFKKTYAKENLPKAEDKWLDLINRFRDSSPRYLDVAQLIKHYLGLRNATEYVNHNITLLYLFWEPKNTEQFDLFKKHRDELKEFSEDIAGTSIRFVYRSYPELWSEWEGQGVMGEHLDNLRKRYAVKI